MLSARLFWLLFGKVLGRARQKALHLPPFSRKQRYPVLYGYSPAVLPKPANWDERITVTGYWFLDQAETWEAPGALEQFMASGAPPISIGFGSMAGRSAKKVLPLFLEAISRSGQRTVLLAKREDVEGLELSENVFCIESAPHDWLFPRMTAVVHHGGAGTTGAAFRAGVPQIVLPFIADQHFWGQRIAELGVGPEPLKHKKLSVEQALQAVRTVTQDQTMRKRAVMLGEKVQQEHGVEEAVEAFGRAIKSTTIQKEQR